MPGDEVTWHSASISTQARLRAAKGEFEYMHLRSTFSTLLAVAFLLFFFCLVITSVEGGEEACAVCGLEPSLVLLTALLLALFFFLFLRYIFVAVLRLTSWACLLTVLALLERRTVEPDTLALLTSP